MSKRLLALHSVSASQGQGVRGKSRTIACHEVQQGPSCPSQPDEDDPPHRQMPKKKGFFQSVFTKCNRAMMKQQMLLVFLVGIGLGVALSSRTQSS